MRIHTIRGSSRKCWLAFLGAALSSGSAIAQSTTQGAIAGIVTDPSDAVVPNAKVTLKNNGTLFDQCVCCGVKGIHRFRGRRGLGKNRSTYPRAHTEQEYRGSASS